MKMFMVSLLSVLLSACGKTADSSKAIRPAPVSFELLDSKGTSLITSVKDSITVTYKQNGVSKLQQLSIVKLQRSGTDVTAVARYNGLVITDNAFMSNLSSQTDNPVRDFTISLNGQTLGAIYLDYKGYLANYPKPSSAALTFNGTPVMEDTEGDYFVSGSNINLLQVKQ